MAPIISDMRFGGSRRRGGTEASGAVEQWSETMWSNWWWWLVFGGIAVVVYFLLTGQNLIT
jgi:hypothetical protein